MPTRRAVTGYAVLTACFRDLRGGRRRSVQAVVRVTPPILAWLRIQFGEDLSEVRQLRGRANRGRHPRGSAEWLADHLAGWGADLRVLRPAEVRTALARIGHELVERYAGGRQAARTDSGTG
jgi:predicted DNA-binding transcriptional regulator YafY